jgi:hypothetical protein
LIVDGAASYDPGVGRDLIEEDLATPFGRTTPEARSMMPRASG